MANKQNKKNSSTKEILLFIVLVLIVELVGYFRNDENYAVAGEVNQQQSSISFNMESIPEYSNMPYVSIDNNKPAFKPEEYTTKAFERYSELDNLGRCRSCLCKYL